jgi:hypothetical protein
MHVILQSTVVCILLPGRGYLAFISRLFRAMVVFTLHKVQIATQTDKFIILHVFEWNWMTQSFVELQLSLWRKLQIFVLTPHKFGTANNDPNFCNPLLRTDDNKINSHDKYLCWTNYCLTNIWYYAAPLSLSLWCCALNQIFQLWRIAQWAHFFLLIIKQLQNIA